MKKVIGFWLVGLCVLSAGGQAAPLLLDWGVLDTTSAAQQKVSQRVKAQPKTAAVQRKSARGTVPWLVQFNDVIREEWKTALIAEGAEIRGYMPENGFLVLATPEQIAAIGVLPDVVYVGEFLPEYKRSKQVRRQLARGTGETKEYNVWLYHSSNLEAIAAEMAALPGTTVVQTEALPNRALIRVHLPDSAVDTVTGWGEVEWVDPYLKRQLWNNVATRSSLMNVSNAWSGLGLTGAGQTIAVCDTGLDSGNIGTLHPDFTNRVTGFGWTNGNYSPSYSWADYDSHGTHVAGSVLGNGTMSAGLYKGVAYEADLIMQSGNASLNGIPTDLNRLFQQAFDNGARIHSDSWGYDDNGYYHNDSRNLDMFTWSNRTMLVLIAAGNQGIDANSDGVVDLDSIGSPGTAKNCLTVGAAETDRPEYSAHTWGSSWPSDYPVNPIKDDAISGPDDGTNQGVAAFSSRGPCDDGRIKPDIVAPGTDIISTRSRVSSDTGWGTVANTNYLLMGGTSMATPLTAGAAGLAREWVTTTGGVTNPSGALLKALLINGARNMSPGQYGTGSYREISAARPDNVQGWGHVDLYTTLKPATNQLLDLIDTNSLSTGQSNTFTYTVTSATTNPFILTLAYADYWGTVGSGKQLVNDLDLTVRKPLGSVLYANGRSSLDDLNNVEMIEFAADEVGTYTVTVSARTVPSGGSQPYALVVRGPKADETPAAPTFGANPGPVSAQSGVLTDFTVTASGYPFPVLALESTTAEAGSYLFEPETGYCIYEPPVGDIGTNTFTFSATNTEGTATQIVTVVVAQGPPEAPASIWASTTNDTDFTAAWSSVSGATGYRLDVSTSETFSVSGAGGDALDISGYDLLQYDSSQTYTLPAGTEIESGGYVIISRDQDQSAFETHWGVSLGANVVFLNSGGSIPLLNGGETFLLRDASDVTVDGQTAVAVSGQVTIQRTNATADATLASSWTSTAAPANSTPGSGGVGNGTGGLVINEYSENGTYTYEFVELYYDASGGLPSYVPGYSNLTVAGTSQNVSGLTAGETYYFRVRATNSAGTSSDSSVTNVTTLTTLSAPVFGANPGPVATTSGVAVAFTVSAAGVPAPTLALQSQTASSGSSFNAGTGELTYTAPQADAGTQTFTFSASNSQGTASQIVTVNVAAATAPVFTGGAGPYSTTVGVAVAFTVSASGTPAPTLALQSQTASSGYSFTPATGAFTYTPPAGDVGTPTFTFTAANAAGTLTQVTSVSVSAVPTAPNAPTSIWADPTNSTTFTANWSAASEATSYRLDVSTNATFEAGGGSVNLMSNAGFESGDSTSWTKFESNYSVVSTDPQEGIYHVACTATATRDLMQPVSITGDGVTEYEVSFWYKKPASGNARIWATWASGGQVSGDDLTPDNSYLPIAADWTQVIYTVVPQSGANVLNFEVRTYTGATVYWDNFFVGTSGGGSVPSYLPGYEDRPVAGTSESVTGLVAESTYYFRARAVNGVGMSGNSPTGSVTTRAESVPGTPPVMDAIPALVVGVGTDLFYTVTATEPDGDTMTFACTSAVSTNWWDFDTNTGDFLFEPSAAEVGTNIFSFTATDKDGTSAPAQMSIRVNSQAATNAFEEWVEDLGEDPGDANFVEDADVDGDGMTTWEEYLADTDPTVSNSVLKLEGDYFTAGEVGETTGQIEFSFPASPNRYYQLIYTDDLSATLTNNIGWGSPGMVVTSDAPAAWFGTIRVLLGEPE